MMLCEHTFYMMRLSMAFYRLEPEWKAAAADVKEQAGDAVKLGAVDATVNQQLANKYGVCCLVI